MAELADDPVTALGREGSSPSLRIGKELASASSLFLYKQGQRFCSFFSIS